MVDSLIHRPAAFLDRDGTLIVERDFLGDPDGVQILPGVPEAIRLLNAWGYWVIGVSNQSGIARGYYGTKEVEAVNERVIETLAKENAYLNRIYYCPHLPEISIARNEPVCNCRKPATGMIEHAGKDYPIDHKGSFVAGDRVLDIGLAHNAKLPGLLVLTGYGLREQELFGADDAPDVIADDLLTAVRWFGRKMGFPDIASAYD
ncbi:MAG: HAD family hydrolase [candidate division Zixibacteria bacterium]|nr:HAD family hydrolase [candidate division Zixibacteria bacterium]